MSNVDIVEVIIDDGGPDIVDVVDMGFTGPAGADGPAGPNLVSTSTATAINGLLGGNGSTVIQVSSLGNITLLGAIGTTANLPIRTGVNGVLQTDTIANYRTMLGLGPTDDVTFDDVISTRLFVGGSGGPRLENNAGAIRARSNDGLSDAPFSAGTITASGDVSLTTGNVIKTATASNLMIQSFRGVSLLAASNFGFTFANGSAGGGNLASDAFNRWTLTQDSGTRVPWTIRQLAGASANFQECRNSSDAIVFSVGPSGNITASGTVQCGSVGLNRLPVTNVPLAVQSNATSSDAFYMYNVAGGLILDAGASSGGHSRLRMRNSVGTVNIELNSSNGQIAATAFNPGNATFQEVSGAMLCRTSGSTIDAYFGNSNPLATNATVYLQQAGLNRLVLGTNSRVAIGPGNQFPSSNFSVHLNGAHNGYGVLLVTGTATSPGELIRAEDSGNVAQFTVSSNGNITASGWIDAAHRPFTFAGLPLASASTNKTFVCTDSTLAMSGANYGATPAGGGSNRVKVFSNGTNWVLG